MKPSLLKFQVWNLCSLFIGTLEAMSSFHQQFASMPPPKPSALVGIAATSGKGGNKGGSSVPAPGSGGYGGPSAGLGPSAAQGASSVPFASGSSFEGFGGSSPAVEANVIHIENKKWLVEPSIPYKPGGTHPYATSDIRRNMNRPSCTAVWQGDQEVIFLYGYFENTEDNIRKFFGSEGVGKSQIPPFYGDQNYISLRACKKECWERSNWRKRTMNGSMTRIWSFIG